MLDDLLNELITVQHAMRQHNIPFLLGGGMGLFLRDTYHGGTRQPRYPRSVPSRSTKDLDLFLTAEVIADANRMNALRDIIEHLGYKPLTNYFQFQKSVQIDGNERTLRIDLLAPPPSDEQSSAVKIKRPRISPTASANIHALDIFRIVTDMTEEDWNAASAQQAADARKHYLQQAVTIQQEAFDDEFAPGVIAFRETEVFRANSEEFNSYVPTVVTDLRELFTLPLGT